MIRKIYCQRIVQLSTVAAGVSRAVLATLAAPGVVADARAAPRQAAAVPFDIEKSAVLY
jgi:hypothetical protein